MNAKNNSKQEKNSLIDWKNINENKKSQKPHTSFRVFNTIQNPESIIIITLFDIGHTLCNVFEISLILFLYLINYYYFLKARLCNKHVYTIVARV